MNEHGKASLTPGGEGVKPGGHETGILKNVLVPPVEVKTANAPDEPEMKVEEPKSRSKAKAAEVEKSEGRVLDRTLSDNVVVKDR